MQMPHPSAGLVNLVRSPMNLSETPVVEKRPPPLLGEHTQEILKERLHLSDTEIAQLQNKGII